MRFFRTILAPFFTLSALCSIGADSALAAQVVCIASNGALTVRESKCLATESKASMTNLPQSGAKGATGAAGVGGIGARRVEKIGDIQAFFASGQSHVFAFCDSDEVLLGGGCGCFEGIGCNSAISSAGPMPIVAAQGARNGFRCTMAATHDTSLDFGEYRAYSICAQVQ